MNGGGGGRGRAMGLERTIFHQPIWSKIMFGEYLYMTGR